MSSPTKLRQIAKELGWPPELTKAADKLQKLRADNAALRNEIARLNNQTNWVCKCGGTDCAGQKENAALKEEIAKYKRSTYLLDKLFTSSKDVIFLTDDDLRKTKDVQHIGNNDIRPLDV